MSDNPDILGSPICCRPAPSEVATPGRCTWPATACWENGPAPHPRSCRCDDCQHDAATEHASQQW